MNAVGKRIVAAADVLSKRIDKLVNAARKEDFALAITNLDDITDTCEEYKIEFQEELDAEDEVEEIEADWIPVESTALERIAYLDEDDVLAVQFKNDRKIHKYPVPKNVWLQLLGARSKGRFFQQNIRNAYTEII